MGAKDSKRSTCLCYEDAVKRMSDIEYKRICEAFKRLAGPNAVLLNKSAFIQNVLDDGVPSVIAEWLYAACGGSAKGMSQRDLVCGLVLLTRGTEEEKVRFLWSLYSTDGYVGWIQRTELEKALRLEGAEPQMIQQTIGSLFRADHPDKVGYEQFKSYLACNREATVLSRWLLICLNSLSPDGSTTNGSTSFYQSLAGVTHLHERDIADLEKAFWVVQAQSPTSQLDRGALMALVSPPVPANMCHGLFAALDENQDGHVDFKELCCGISAACRGPKAERMKFCFKIFDMDRDNHLNAAELDHLHKSLSFISATNQSSSSSTLPDQPQISTKIECPIPSLQNDAGLLSLQDFLVWAIQQEESIDPLLQLLFEVGHVSIGLRPQCRHLERDIVLGWRHREKERGYRVGQYWYLISSEWWSSWLSYTSAVGSGGVCSECGRSSVNNQQQESNYGGSSASTSTDSISGGGDLVLLKGTGGDTSSLGSSSGVSSTSNPVVSIPTESPGPVDNAPLLYTMIGSGGAVTTMVPTLTGEGGRLRTDIALCEDRDFTLVPDSLWKAIAMWYGGSVPLPRQVIMAPGAAEPELELYPLNLRILRHHQQQQSNGGHVVVGETRNSSPPSRYLAYTAAFSRLATVRQVAEFLAAPLQRRPDEVRLWLVSGNETLMAVEMADEVDEDPDLEVTTLHELGVRNGDQLLLEVRNGDLTWPEEMGALAQASKTAQTAGVVDSRRATIGGNLPTGATGLHNLGNTCFMNAALQTLSNTPPLTLYFLRNTHLCELNPLNPMGSRGQVARRYAELVHQLWAPAPGHARSVAPLRLRWCVSKHAPDTLGSGGQHDSQELLAWLLDQLHEDLNRVRGEKKLYRELGDSGGRPDEEVAAEAWRLHSARDASIITDLFYGQLKSKVTCESCKHESVRFDAFNLLSLPLPMENYTLYEVLVLPRSCPGRIDHRVPIKYGVRLPLKHGVARVKHLKRQLQRLCAVHPSRLLVTQLAHAQIQRLLHDDEPLPTQSSNGRTYTNAVELVAFEVPPPRAASTGEPERDCGSAVDVDSSDDDDQEPKSGSLRTVREWHMATGTATVSAGDGQMLVRSPTEVRASSALCMPNILCFKATVTVGGASLLQPSPSPTTTTASIRSHVFTDQPSSTNVVQPTSTGQSNTLPPYLIALHRKTLRQETYFLHQQRSKPSLFGIPMLLACDGTATTGQDLYEDAWRQVARLLSPLPPDGSGGNHATDCDDSLGYEFPFTLRAVLPGGQICALCHWTHFCRGCPIPSCPDTRLCDLCTATAAELVIAVDWDPTALHLRYQAGREKEYVQHESLFEARRLHTEPIDLDHCLRAFTQEERLEAKYHCGGCKSKQAATKKLQIWRLPPILIVHLKRFDRATCLDGDVSKWVKTHKVVNFPFDGFDPTAYLAAVPQQTILRHRQLLLLHHGHSIAVDTVVDLLAAIDDGDEQLLMKNGAGSGSSIVRERLESTSLQRTPIQDEHLHDYHQHHLQPGQDPFDLAYQLYAVVSHSGQMSGGHYVSYAHNPNGHWYCYNDSSCREVALDHLRANIDPSAAYLLFYERKGLDYRPYVPDQQQETTTTDATTVTLADGEEGSLPVVKLETSVAAASEAAPAPVSVDASSELRRQFCHIQ